MLSLELRDVRGIVKMLMRVCSQTFDLTCAEVWECLCMHIYEQMGCVSRQCIQKLGDYKGPGIIMCSLMEWWLFITLPVVLFSMRMFCFKFVWM